MRKIFVASSKMPSMLELVAQDVVELAEYL